MRFGNVDGRGAIVRGDTSYDVKSVSDGALPSDPMALVVSHWAAVL